MLPSFAQRMIPPIYRLICGSDDPEARHTLQGQYNVIDTLRSNGHDTLFTLVALPYGGAPAERLFLGFKTRQLMHLGVSAL